ncbi:hypothetical protein NDU88_006166 [Pleurodeles waltl]|uniref:Uncharacterized protein n=1 Tax=Pleurodeles waltl TaxID=8319 RepID=A0AAV7NR58_PLEWA|nr:hypothetical protein NDU88_006166 [Pleurodeles waltl]
MSDLVWPPDRGLPSGTVVSPRDPGGLPAPEGQSPALPGISVSPVGLCSFQPGRWLLSLGPVSQCRGAFSEAACVFGPYGVPESCSLHSARRDPRPVARALPSPRGASPRGSQYLSLSRTGHRNSSPLLLRAGAQRRSSSAGAFPPVDIPTPLKRPRQERGSDPFVGLTGGSGSERPRLGSRASAPPRRPGPGCHFVFVGMGYGTGTGGVLGHLFTSAWSPMGREPTGALEAAPSAQQTAAYSGG